MIKHNYKSEDYTQNNNSQRKLLERSLMIPEHKDLRSNMILECISIVNTIKKFSKKNPSNQTIYSPVIKSYTIHNANNESAYFTLMFPTPMIYFTHKSFCHLHSRFRYYKQYGKIDQIPCYIMNLNHVSLSTTYPGYNITNEINTQNIYRKITSKKGKPLIFYSTNILFHGSSEENIQRHGHEAIEKCFQYCYWCLPTPKNTHDASCIHNLIYHNYQQILDNGVIQLRKTLIKITKIKNIYDYKQICPMKPPTKCFRAECIILVDSSEKILAEKSFIYLIDDLKKQLNDGDIINALVVIHNIHKNFFVIGQIGDKIMPYDIKSMTSIILWKSLQNIHKNSQLMKVDHISGIVQSIQDTLEDNFGENAIFDYRIISNNIEKHIKTSIKELFPLYVLDDDYVYQLSPTVLAFILAIKPEIITNKNMISIIIELFDMIDINSKNWGEAAQSQLTSTVKNYKSFSANTLLENLPNLSTQILYSRIFSQHQLSRT